MTGEYNEFMQAHLPRSMDGENLKIARFYTEAGYFGEANCLMVTDGTRAALYAPLRLATEKELLENLKKENA